MQLYKINGKKPVVGKGSFIAPGAVLIGDVLVGEEVYIGFNAVLRADLGRIIIGDRCAIEDGVIIHCAKECRIGCNVIVGHQAVIHNATIGDWTLVGMQSLVSDNAVMEDWSILAEKSHVPKNELVSGGKIFSGIPAREAGPLEERHRDMLRMGIDVYRELSRQGRENLRQV